MKEETKEILNKLLEYFKESNINDFGYEKDKLISYEEAQILLDYITNLQQELQEANESITWWSNRFKAVERDNERLKENNKKKTSRCTERNHRIRGCQRVIERRNKKISKLEQQLENYKQRNEKSLEYINNLLKSDDIPLVDVILTTIKEKLGGDEE